MGLFIFNAFIIEYILIWIIIFYEKPISPQNLLRKTLKNLLSLLAKDFSHLLLSGHSCSTDSKKPTMSSHPFSGSLSVRSLLTPSAVHYYFRSLHCTLLKSLASV